MNCTKGFRFDFLGAVKCLCDCETRLKNELAHFLEVKVCTFQTSNGFLVVVFVFCTEMG